MKKGLSVYDVDVSLLRNLSPDLIVTQAQCEACAVSLNEVQEIVSKWTENQTKILSLEPNTLNDVWLDFDRVAKAMDVPESTSMINSEILDRLKILKTNCFVHRMDRSDNGCCQLGSRTCQPRWRCEPT